MPMRERIARAAYASHFHCSEDEWSNGGLPPSSRERYLRIADAVLAAMREPTEAMLDAACEVGPDTPYGGFGCDDATTIFQAMIDAAISEGKT